MMHFMFVFMHVLYFDVIGKSGKCALIRVRFLKPICDNFKEKKISARCANQIILSNTTRNIHD